MSDFDGGMEMIDPVPLSDEDRADWGGGVTYVGPDGPENRLDAAGGVVSLAVRRRRRQGATARLVGTAGAGRSRAAA